VDEDSAIMGNPGEPGETLRVTFSIV